MYIKSQVELDKMIAEVEKKHKEMSISASETWGSFCLVITRTADGGYYLFSYHDDSHDVFKHDEFMQSLYGELIAKGKLYTYTFD